MMRTIQSELQRNKLSKKQVKDQQPKKKKEQLDRRDIEELMGMNKPKFRRSKGGAYRNY